MHDDLYDCPGCGASFTARELGDPVLNFRHTRCCRVRWRREGSVGCAWAWPYPFSLRNAFALGERNVFEVAARDRFELPSIATRFSGAARRLDCEARARYTEGVLR